MKKLPYFRWYPADADTDELYCSLTDEELGFFHRCLNKSWVNCGLPADLNELASMMRVNREYLDRLWPKVGRAWTAKDGRLFNNRQEEERAYASGKSDQASSAANSRYGRTADALRTHSARTADALPRAYVSVSDSGFDFEVWFSGRMRKHPIPGKPQIAQQYAIDKITIGKLTPSEFDASHDAWCEYWKTQEGGIPTLATFIYESWYERKPPETKRKLTAQERVIEEAKALVREERDRGRKVG